MSNILMVIRIVAMGLAGTLTLGYSGIQSFSVFLVDFRSGVGRGLLFLCPVLAFPVFLLAFKSGRLSTIGLWLLFVESWLRCCGFSLNPRTLCWNPLESPADKMLFFAAVSMTVVYVLSLAEGNRPKAAVQNL